jgi:hypothetical protein
MTISRVAGMLMTIPAGALIGLILLRVIFSKNIERGMLIDQVSSFFGRYWHTHYNEIANDRKPGPTQY